MEVLSVHLTIPLSLTDSSLDGIGSIQVSSLSGAPPSTMPATDAPTL